MKTYEMIKELFDSCHGKSNSTVEEIETDNLDEYMKKYITKVSENGQRLIWDAGCYELPRQRAEIGARMFQAGKSKKKIRRGK